MALKDDVLNDFFNNRKEPKTQKSFRHDTATKSIAVEAPEKPENLKQQYKNYRVFDNPEENLRQTQDKPRTNLGQSWDNLETELETNLGQQNKTQDKPKTEPRTEHRTNLGQSWDKPKTNIHFVSLVGLQKKIVIFLYELCKSSRDKITNPLSIENLAIACNTTKISAQKTIQRLENKGVLRRADFKNGRGGWTKYEIPESIYQEILYIESQDKLRTNLGQSWDKPKTEPRTEPRTSSPSSSGNNININNKTTTTSDNGNSTSQNSSLTNEWVEIDIEPLSSIGFTQTHLIQIASQNKLQPKIVQDSIYAFAFDLEENGRAKTIKGDPINFFMGIVRNGRPYLPPSNYESPQDKSMRVYLGRMREIEQQRAGEEKEALNLAFNDWFSKLSVEQKREFLPPTMRGTTNVETSEMLKNTAKSHFEKEIWDLNKLKIITQE